MSARVIAGGQPRRRILMLGPVGSLHVTDMAAVLHARGHDVVVGGPLWDGENEPAAIDDNIPVRVRTWPTARWMRRLLSETRLRSRWSPLQLHGTVPLAAAADDRDRGQGHVEGSHPLPPDSRRPRRAHVRGAQVPHDARRGRCHEGGARRAYETDGLFKIATDPRFTPIGGFLSDSVMRSRPVHLGVTSRRCRRAGGPAPARPP